MVKEVFKGIDKMLDNLVKEYNDLNEDFLKNNNNGFDKSYLNNILLLPNNKVAYLTSYIKGNFEDYVLIYHESKIDIVNIRRRDLKKYIIIL